MCLPIWIIHNLAHCQLRVSVRLKGVCCAECQVCTTGKYHFVMFIFMALSCITRWGMPSVHCRLCVSNHAVLFPPRGSPALCSVPPSPLSISQLLLLFQILNSLGVILDNQSSCKAHDTAVTLLLRFAHSINSELSHQGLSFASFWSFNRLLSKQLHLTS